MRTVTVFTSVKVDLRTINDRALTDLLSKNPALRKRLPVIEEDVEANVPLSLISDDDLLAELRERELLHGDWLERTYRYLAEGDVASAMDEMQREFKLAPPSHECRLADLLTGLRN